MSICRLIQTLDPVFWHHAANAPARLSEAKYGPICEEVHAFKV
jgi:hypothetical protein